MIAATRSNNIAVQLFLAAAVVVGLVGCGDDVTVPGPQPTIDNVTVSPDRVELAPGETTTVSVSIVTRNGVEGLSVSWSSTDSTVATVSSTGDRTAEVTAEAEGDVGITATVTASNVDGDFSGASTARIEAEELQEASITLGQVTDSSGDPVDVEDVSGQINVTVNVEEGDETVDRISVLLDGTVVSTQDISSAAAARDTAAARAAGDVEEITFNLRTDRIEGSTPDDAITVADVAKDGNVKRGQFQNGEHSLSARITTAEGGTRSAGSSRALRFDNPNRVVVDHLSGGKGVVEPASGHVYRGGEDIRISVTPVVFDPALELGDITLDVAAGAQTANGTASFALAPGATVGAEPYVYTLPASSNSSDAGGGGPESDPAGSGATFSVDDVRDSDGATVFGDFSVTDLDGFFVDFVAPELAGSVEFDGVGTAVPGGNVYYSGFEGGGTVAIVLPDVVDRGVGGIDRDAGEAYTAPGPDYTVDIEDGGGSTLFSDVSATWELPEQAPSGSGGSTDHFASLQSVEDALGNAPSNLSGINTPVGDFGVDQTAPDDSGASPSGAASSSPDAAGASFVFNGDASGFPGGANELQVDLADPALANGETPSGTDHGDSRVTVFEDASGSSVAGSEVVSTNRNGDADPGDYAIDVSAVPDGSYALVLGFNDAAERSNGDSQVWNFILDTTDPSINISAAPSDKGPTTAGSVDMTIEGDASDENGLSSAVVSVLDSGDGDCSTTGDNVLLDPAAGEVDQNEVDVTSSASDFGVTFSISDPGGDTTITYCFTVDGADTARDNTGALDANTDAVLTSADIDWD